MTTIYRAPRRVVVVKGTPLARVYSLRVTRGWDQALATAEVTVPYPLPAGVGHRSMIWIYAGADNVKLRFTGYITSIHNTIWPGRVVLGCEDVLALAKYNKVLGTYSLAGMTDEEAVRWLLDFIDMPRYDPANIQGTGKVIGADTSNPALTLQPTESILGKIQQIDQSSIYDIESGARKGIYRTFADTGGNIFRIPLDPMPSSAAARAFYEGVDILSGGASIEAVEPTTTTMAAGYGGLTHESSPTTNPWAVMSHSGYKIIPTVEEELAASGKHNLEDISEYLNQQGSYNVIRLDFVTHRDDVIAAQETEFLESHRAQWKGNAHLQSVTLDQSESGALTQQVSLVSYRELNTYEGGGGVPGLSVGPIAEDNPFTGTDIPPDDPPEQPGPEPSDVLASYTVKVLDVETILVDGAYTGLITVACEDTSSSATGDIVSWTWTAPTATPSSGSERTFNPNFASFEGATVELAVEDANGNTATTGPLPVSVGMGAPTQQRQLYTPEGDKIAAFNGTEWHTATATQADSVGNGPIWGDDDQAATSPDDLVTAPAYAVPFPGLQVTSVWVELDVSKTRMAAGGSLGNVAISEDGGLTWTICTQLADTASPVIQVILSRSTPGQVWALQPSGISVSDDNGATWRVLRAAAPGQLFSALRLTNFRNVVASTGAPTAGLEGAEDAANVATFPGGENVGIRGVAANIYADELCVISTDIPPRLFVTDGEGSWNFVPAETPDLTGYPDSIPSDNCLQQDSGIGRMLYAGVGRYALKTTDWWKPGTIHTLREVAVAGAGAGPITMVGVGEFSDSALNPAGLVYVGGADGLFRSPDATTFTSILPGFGFITAFDVVGSTVMVCLGDGTVKRSTDGGDTWADVTTPTGFGVFGVLILDMATELNAILVNGNLDAWTTADGGTTWAPFTPIADVDRIYGGPASIWQTTVTGLSAVRTLGSDNTITFTKEVVDCHPIADTLAFFFRPYFSGTPGSRPNALFMTTDGTTATEITPPGAQPSAWIDAASPDGTTVVALVVNNESTAGLTGQLWRSVDGGGTWTKVLEDPGLMPQHSESGSIAFDFADPTRWYCLGGYYDVDLGFYTQDAPLWVSTDSGATWTATVVQAGEIQLRRVRTSKPV